MSSAGAVVGAIAAHTVITTIARNQAEKPPVEPEMTQEERSQASHDFMAGFIKQVYWTFGGLGVLMLVIVILNVIF